MFAIALDLEPVSDLVPTASTSTTGVEIEDAIAKPEKNTVELQPVVVEESIVTVTNTVSASTTRNKRRSQDEITTTTPSNKKPRRMSKIRGRRVKV